MKTIADIINYVMEEYERLRNEGKFDPDCWDGDNFTLPLVRPWPSEYTISVNGYADYYDEDHHFEVKILDAAEKEIVFCHSGAMAIYETDLDYTLYRAFENLCWEKWPDLAAENAWKVFLDIPVDDKDRIAEPFMKFQEGEKKEVVLAWFNRIYRLGLPALRARVEDNAPLIRYRVPVLWQMMAYVDVVGKSRTEAFEYLRSPMFSLPKGEYLEDSFVIDESNVEELTV